MRDQLVSRILGAVRPVDATTGAPIVAGLTVTSDQARLVRNRRGLFVISEATALPGYHRAFATAPATPLPGTVPITLTVRDLARRYLPRQATLALPRDADPAHAAQADSLFQPIELPLFPSPSASAEPGWALLRVSVRRAGTTQGIASAFVRVHRAGAPGEVLARGFADGRGEAFVPVAGIPVAIWSSSPDAPVLATGVDAVVVAYFDPAAGDPPDPAAIEAHRDTLTSASAGVHLAPGREVTAVVELTLP